MISDEDPSPVNPVSPVIVALFLCIVGVEAAFSLGARGLIGGPGAVGWRISSMEQYGFHSEIMQWMLQTGRTPSEHLIRFLSYPFIHGSFTHALFGGAMLLALGKFVGDVFSSVATLLLFVISIIAGAVAFGFLNYSDPWLIGVFPGVYGLIGGFTYIMWLRLGQLGEAQIRAFTLIGFLLCFQLIIGLLFGAQGDWIADLAGFAAGFLASFFLSPGGFQKIRSKLQG